MIRLSAALVLASMPLASQDTDRGRQDPPDRDAVLASLDAWTKAERPIDTELDRIVAGVLGCGEPALAALALRRSKATRDDEEGLRGRLDLAITRLGVAVLHRERNRGMVFAGQYSDLRPLMPWIGRTYLRFLVDTPDWFPHTWRSFLVPPLRDLYRVPPPAEELEVIRRIAKNEEIEPENLRLQLSFALYQWGEPGMANEHMAGIQKNIRAGDEEDALPWQRLLADVYYQLRLYRRAAQTHGEYLVAAKKYRIPLFPDDYYNAACSCALAGKSDDAFAHLRQAVAAHLEEDPESGRRLSRSLFEKDPELRSLRKDPRFDPLVQKAFEGAPGNRDGHSGGR